MDAIRSVDIYEHFMRWRVELHFFLAPVLKPPFQNASSVVGCWGGVALYPASQTVQNLRNNCGGER